MQCVILVGGLGTRLGKLTKDLPKPLLAVAGCPFLDHLIAHYSAHGFDKFLLLAGFRADAIFDYCIVTRRKFPQLKCITVVEESKPQGTAGALYLAERQLEENFLLVNGDTYFDFNIGKLIGGSNSKFAIANIALRQIPDASRYGVVELNADGRVSKMHERPLKSGPGLINCGVYWMHRDIIGILDPGPCSMEKDIFPRLIAAGGLYAREFTGYFIDIGVPVDLRAAEQYFSTRN